MQFTQQFLETLMEEGVAHKETGESAELFLELFMEDIEDQEHWKLIFQFAGDYYQVPYVLCGEVRFNENLAVYNGEDIYQYIEELYEKPWNPDEIVECTILEDITITLSSDQVEELLEQSTISFEGEPIQLTAPIETNDEDEYETFSYKGDSYGFANSLVGEKKNIECRTIPYLEL